MALEGPSRPPGSVDIQVVSPDERWHAFPPNEPAGDVGPRFTSLRDAELGESVGEAIEDWPFESPSPRRVFR